MAANRYRAGETRILLWQLGTAAEKGLPLAPAAYAFGLERGDEMGRRALRLGAALAGGAPLEEALRQARLRMPFDLALAIRLHLGKDELGHAIRDAVMAGGRRSPEAMSLLQRLLYLVMMTVMGTGILTFLMVKIIPTFQAIFTDFELSLPRPTLLVIACCESVARHWYVGAFLYVLFLALLAGLLFGVCYYIGWIRWEPPLLRQLMRPYHGTLVLQSLAVEIERQHTLPQALAVISRNYPVKDVGHRVWRALRRVNDGADWCDSLAGVGLIHKATAAVLKSAQRVGNLPWACREMATSGHRRWAFRLHFWTQLVTLFLIFAFAGVVALVAVAVIVPLSALIGNLT
jgi:type II secretory pathway component PulF